jgi:DNA-binding CsgD family transcriptional regulator
VSEAPPIKLGVLSCSPWWTVERKARRVRKYPPDVDSPSCRMRVCKSCSTASPFFYFSVNGCVCYDCKLEGVEDYCSPDAVVRTVVISDAERSLFESASLSPRERDVLLLLYGCDMTAVEAAGTCNTSRQRILHARSTAVGKLKRAGLSLPKHKQQAAPKFRSMDPGLMDKIFADPKAVNPLDAAASKDRPTPPEELARRRRAWESSRPRSTRWPSRCADAWRAIPL